MSDSTPGQSKYPVIHNSGQATGYTANQHCWPEQLNLKVLNQRSSLVDPMVNPTRWDMGYFGVLLGYDWEQTAKRIRPRTMDANSGI